MATITGLLAVNPAFLLEIKEDNRELRSLLAGARHCLATPHCAQQVREAFLLLSRLRDQLAMHFSLEEAYGYLDDALHCAPHLSELAIELKSQHAMLYVELCQIVDTAEEFVYIPADPDAFLRVVVGRFEEFNARFQQHEQAEQQLILAAFDDDIGVGD
jgi:hypothetical protein